MPIVGAGVLVLLAIIVSTSLTSASPEPEAIITASVGGEVARAKIDFPLLPAPQPTAFPEPEVVAEVKVVAPVPRPKVEPTLKLLPAPAPAPVPAPAVEIPKQDPAISVCLGKFVGTSCTFTKDGDEKVGTCMTPAFSPVICVPH